MVKKVEKVKRCEGCERFERVYFFMFFLFFCFFVGKGKKENEKFVEVVRGGEKRVGTDCLFVCKKDEGCGLETSRRNVQEIRKFGLEWQELARMAGMVGKLGMHQT